MSFKIICQNCDSEIEIKDNFVSIGSENTIEIFSTREDRIIIECINCGNEIASE